MVTPFVGVWIETPQTYAVAYCYNVTPFVGVWIETYPVAFKPFGDTSHPSWVCGLKPLAVLR